jgi:hypothetical protein
MVEAGVTVTRDQVFSPRASLQFGPTRQRTPVARPPAVQGLLDVAVA